MLFGLQYNVDFSYILHNIHSSKMCEINHLDFTKKNVLSCINVFIIINMACVNFYFFLYNLCF